ncbi:hypothetical protein DB42_EV00020 [Neochlamydia sp. EPS4]|nr:hypothetical protein DB42_EV00020 [Neochlamydia sp. EPS4]
MMTFQYFYFFKGNIKKLKKQVKGIRIFNNKKQLTDNLQSFFFS